MRTGDTPLNISTTMVMHMANKKVEHGETDHQEQCGYNNVTNHPSGKSQYIDGMFTSIHSHAW